jgi:hypothetical protein
LRYTESPPGDDDPILMIFKPERGERKKEEKPFVPSRFLGIGYTMHLPALGVDEERCRSLPRGSARSIDFFSISLFSSLTNRTVVVARSRFYFVHDDE